MQHYEIEIRNRYGEYIGGWGRLDSFQDVKDCFYSRFNNCEFCLTCKYLKYYDEYSNFKSEKNFEIWRSSNDLLFILIGNDYYEEAHIVVVD